MLRTRRAALVLAILVCFAAPATAQGWFTPPPPAGNPVTFEKDALGAALFWDEQLSSSNSVACGSCHIMERGGVDPRTGMPGSVHPGADGILATADDVLGSPGLVRRLADGHFDPSPAFGLARQVTGRRAISAINALFSAELFWDGRAAFSYTSPVSGQVLLPAFAALESQAAGPPVSDVEMAHVGRDWNAVAAKIAAATPLALAPQVPARLSNWIAGRDYAALFAEAFGSPGVDADRLIFAIATYERSLLSDRTRFDSYQRGDPGALTAQELRGKDLFENKAKCIECHTYPHLGRQQFEYTGVRPVTEDSGRFAVTGNPADLGRLITPDLRNVALRAPFFHNGGAPTLAAVVDFYDRGGDFSHANKSPFVVPLGLTPTEKNDLVVFLRDALGAWHRASLSMIPPGSAAR